MSTSITKPPRLFCFGLGYSALHLARALVVEAGVAEEGWTIAGTCQTHEARDALAAEGFDIHLFDGTAPLADPGGILAGTTHILCSVPPGAGGDSVLRHHGADIVALARDSSLDWLGYLSSTAVYGDTGGARVDESAPTNPTSARGTRRVAAEAGWLALHREANVPVHIFRLSGIYGPGRNVLDQVRAGTAKRIDKPDHRFSRIHVDDIVGVLRASMDKPDAGTVYNICDDEAASPADVVVHAAHLLNVPPPPAVAFAEAFAAMSPMARTFWHDNRLVDNQRMKQALGIRLKYASYQAGLLAILENEE